MSELKPCPFCGGEAMHSVCSDKKFHLIECNSCGVETDHHATKYSAFKYWNTRHIPKGYALVPVEPTDEMLIAARDWSIKVIGRSVGDSGAIGCYKAMIKATQDQQKCS